MNRVRFAHVGVALASLLVSTRQVLAQVPPPAAAPQINPGLISNQNQQTRLQVEQQSQLPATAPVAPSPPSQYGVAAPGGPTFVLRKVVVDASHFLSKEEISAITNK